MACRSKDKHARLHSLVLQLNPIELLYHVHLVSDSSAMTVGVIIITIVVVIVVVSV